jgi:hypothetical protein
MNDLTLTTPPPGIAAADYAAIEEAVMETARGRWFLLEYARRQRAAETQRLADAVDRLERAIETMQPQFFATAAAAPAPELLAAPTNETAAAVAEKLSDIVWTMRERGVGDQFCAELEKQIRIIRTLRVEIEAGRDEPGAPSEIGYGGRQDTVDVSPAIRPANSTEDRRHSPDPHAEEALKAPSRSMIQGSTTLPPFETRLSGAPQDEDSGSRSDSEPSAVDRRAAPQFEVASAPPPKPLELPPPWRPLEARAEPAAPPQKPAVDPRIAALARLDALPLSDKLALFC